MTYKEKLQKEHPGKVDDRYTAGGCYGCPCDYGYEEESEAGQPGHPCSEVKCTLCWNREMPATEPCVWCRMMTKSEIYESKTEKHIRFKFCPVCGRKLEESK